MPRYRVIVTEMAREQVREISRWWKANRPQRPNLFREELAGARHLLLRIPNAGSRYRLSKYPNVRRLLLLRTRHHVYYVVNETQRLVTILAVWHTSREYGPPL
ncbi:MAG: type II toxin-antitoxin system RelE/ParE family toxin [Polyangiaceae bacterium]|nr:type II toxin-antitoxin system RelE/ParE family toxin [Polyangiaceae bacterium]